MAEALCTYLFKVQHFEKKIDNYSALIIEKPAVVDSTLKAILNYIYQALGSAQSTKKFNQEGKAMGLVQAMLKFPSLKSHHKAMIDASVEKLLLLVCDPAMQPGVQHLNVTAEENFDNLARKKGLIVAFMWATAYLKQNKFDFSERRQLAAKIIFRAEQHSKLMLDQVKTGDFFEVLSRK